MRLPIGKIAEYTSADYLVEPQGLEKEACGVTWDSREVKPGFVYVALPGERVDGHDFVEGALRSGAVAALVMHELPDAVLETAKAEGAAILRVDETARAFTALARGWRGHLQGKVVALTGSMGKTTTKNLVRDVLSTTFKTVATKANQNNELGVPRTLLEANADTEFVVVEMGMRGLGQLEELCAFVKPDISLITNVGECHMELLGSKENIARAKAEVLDALADGSGIAVLNAAPSSVSGQSSTSGTSRRSFIMVRAFALVGFPRLSLLLMRPTSSSTKRVALRLRSIFPTGSTLALLRCAVLIMPIMLVLQLLSVGRVAFLPMRLLPVLAHRRRNRAARKWFAPKAVSPLSTMLTTLILIRCALRLLCFVR